MKFNDAYIPSLANSGPVRGLVRGVADRIAARARSTAKVDTGAYRDGIIVEMRETASRPIAVVVSTDEATLLIEARTGNLVKALNSQASRG